MDYYLYKRKNYLLMIYLYEKKCSMTKKKINKKKFLK